MWFLQVVRELRVPFYLPSTLATGQACHTIKKYVIYTQSYISYELPQWLRGKDFAGNAEDMGLIPWSEEPLEEEMAIRSSGFQAIRLPEKPHGQRRLEGYSPWDRRVGHDSVTEQQSQLWAKLPRGIFPCTFPRPLLLHRVFCGWVTTLPQPSLFSEEFHLAKSFLLVK